MIHKLLHRTLTRRFVTKQASNVKLTLFTKPGCGLCEAADEVVVDVLEQYPKTVQYCKININDRRNRKWFKAYCFDIPVLHIENTTSTTNVQKLMHYIRDDELTSLLNDCDS